METVYETFEVMTDWTYPQYRNYKEDAYIFDIDGTLALRAGDDPRQPYEWLRVGEDIINAPVAKILKNLSKDHRIILVSGRDSICEPETRQWIVEQGIAFDALFMRGVKDNRKDSIVKLEIAQKWLAPRYNILGVFDDRNQVVEMWRSIGLTCFQVAPGDF